MSDYKHRGYNDNTCPHCGASGGLSKQVWALVENTPTEG